MANALYDKAREEYLAGILSWINDDIRCILVDTAAHTIDTGAANPKLADIAGGARISVSGALTGKSVTGGVADANDVTFTAVSGATVEALVLYKHTGAESTARLIGVIDTATGLTLTPNGGDVLCTWSDGANKIFKL